MSTGYAYVWEFRVRADRTAEFEAAYGPNGKWVELFRKADGYVGTDLLKDRADATRFLTIDRWESAEAWERFREEFSAEFEAIDRRCEALTESEAELGRFDFGGLV